MKFSTKTNEYLELYTVQHSNVLAELINKKKYVAKGYNSKTLKHNYINMSIYISIKNKNIVKKPIFCFVANKSVEQQILKGDFCGFNFKKGDIILHLQVPLKYCTVYEFNWFDYFNKYSTLLKNIIRERAAMNTEGLHCCLPYIKYEWLVNSEKYIKSPS
ncbi:hypothetical protein [Paenibacillus sp. FSL R5-0914]|uniref:hypothetical protein n=1 Tax=Paenibacillus sp. FSL R5-0914 TaxID=2921665 RepID=UPI0030F948C4